MAPNAVGLPALDWVIAGGESGDGARPMHPEWPANIAAQCARAHVPCLFKQWGAWVPEYTKTSAAKVTRIVPSMGAFPAARMELFGKEDAGRLLNGRLIDEFPV